MELWRLVDGKAGHMRQSAALASAIQGLPGHGDITVRDVTVPGIGGLPGLVGRARAKKPMLAIGAGHGTHLALVALKRLAKVRTVVLMRPSLPLKLFDVCVIPEHDGVQGGPGIITTFGPLAPTPAVRARDKNLIVVLIGGPSGHYLFEPEIIEASIHWLLDTQPGTNLVISDSRRTPDGFLAHLRERFERVDCISYNNCSSDWLPGMLAQARCAWITEDSLSMPFEALTAGCPVGVIEQPIRKPSRVTLMMDRLKSEGWVMTRAAPVVAARPSLNEAQRVARVLFPECASPTAG